ncbi:amidohydrolase family protein [Mesorhizobium sp. CGMCC 1.15528]|uniref:Amidohydrolase family protein n=1 Tax=Mesorhizobium zhangyense TaxID=1776730 RepID=A0A7C9RBQ4_9HYPH|nr:amidohydrolase family protein [Mesorhizobium zhangyense]NGN45034.1 amidohydrolase family protein [Mesorhizobium zhangyense]
MTAIWFNNALCLIEAEDGWAAQRHSIEIRNGVIDGLHEPNASIANDCEIIDASGLIAAPGFVNCHSHSPDNLIRGTAGDLPLELWSLSSSAGRESRTPREIYVSALLGAVEMMRTGTTSVLDHVRISPDIEADALAAVAQAWRDSGMRATIAPVVSDRAVLETMPLEAEDIRDIDLSAYGRRRPMPWRRQMQVAEAFFRRWHGSADGRIRAAIGPSGPQRCSDELLTAAADFSARNDTLLHTHVLETSIQRETGFRLYGRGMIDHLDELGVLTPRTNLVHSIWLEDGDAETIAHSGASVIHNPVSNARLGSGFCPLPKLLRAGVRVGLGTDSACCNDGNNLLETVKWAAILHNSHSQNERDWTSPQRALSLATSGGADVLGLGRMAGKIAVGHVADMTLFRIASPAFAPLNDPVRQLVLAETGSAIALVVIAGRIVVRDGHAVDVDEASLWEEAQELSERRQRDNQSAYAATNALEMPIRRMRARLTGGCSCH